MTINPWPIVILSLSALSLGGCQLAPASGAPDETASPASQVSAGALKTTEKSGSASQQDAAAPVAVATDAESGGFTYDYPEALKSRIPALAAQLDTEKKKARSAFDKMVADYPDTGASAAKDALESSTQWKIDSESPHILVLLGDYYDYQGGAHGMYSTRSLIWDKRTNKEIKLLDMFADVSAAKAKIMPSYCAMLDAERLGRRGKPTAKTDLFGDCPDPFEGTVYPADLNKDQYLRIGFSLEPYFAGPYVEGEYEFTIAAPTHITDLLKPEYKDVFQIYG